MTTAPAQLPTAPAARDVRRARRAIEAVLGTHGPSSPSVAPHVDHYLEACEAAGLEPDWAGIEDARVWPTIPAPDMLTLLPWKGAVPGVPLRYVPDDGREPLARTWDEWRGHLERRGYEPSDGTGLVWRRTERAAERWPSCPHGYTAPDAQWRRRRRAGIRLAQLRCAFLEGAPKARAA